MYIAVVELSVALHFPSILSQPLSRPDRGMPP